MSKLNPWLEEALRKTRSPSYVNLIVELESPETVKVLEEAGFAVSPLAFNMVKVSAEFTKIAELAAILGVRKVHYDMPVYIKAAPSIADSFLGKVSLSAVTIPYGPDHIARMLPTYAAGILSLPFRLGKQLFNLPGPFATIQNGDVIIIPTSETARYMGIPENNSVQSIKVAVLDSGAFWPHWQFKSPIRMESLTLGPPQDGLGHGLFSATCAFGGKAKTRFGLCQGMADVKGSNILSIKVLTDLGFGNASSIIKGIERAINWGAQVINLSLGGELEGTVHDDPLCVVIEQVKDKAIFCVAPGNEGPQEWAIGSPGASPHVLTVGSWSTYYNGLSVFSSRGPSGKWYRDHYREWQEDLGQYGNDMIKPDCLSFGGGPVSPMDKPDVIYSGMIGWMDALYDYTPFDGWGALRGCVAKGSQVYTSDGPKAIEDIKIGDKVYSFDGTLIPATVLDSVCHGKKELFRIKATGFEIDVTDSHPLLVMRHKPEWVQCRDLEIGDALILTKLMPENIVPELDNLFTEEMLNFLGWFMGDGWLSAVHRGYTVSLASGNKVDRHYHELFERLFGLKLNYQKSAWGRACSSKIAFILKLVGFGEPHNTIALPNWLFHLSLKKRQAFLKGFINADGGLMQKNYSSYKIELASREAILGLHCLARYSNVRSGRRAFRTRLVKAPGMKIAREMISYSTTMNYHPYHDGHTWKDKFPENLDPDYFILKRLNSIGPIGEDDTYDLSIEGKRNFVCEGFIAHNTSQATPHVAGAVALLLEKGKVKNASDIKVRLREKWAKEKSPAAGYGLFHMSYWNGY